MESLKLGSLQKVRKTTVANQVYDILRKGIIDISLVPGSIISEKETSDNLGISRTPIREAFIRLEREGFLNIYPQRGTHISRINIKRCKEERFIRETLEKGIFEVYMEKHSEESVEKLWLYIENQKKAIEENDTVHYTLYDDKFHNVFYDETESTLSKMFIRNYSVNYSRIRHLSLSLKEDIAGNNTNHHVEIYNAVINNDVKSGLKVFEIHLQKLFSQIDSIVERYPDYFIDI